MLGVPPEDRDTFHAWSEKVARGTVDELRTETAAREADEAGMALAYYFSDLFDLRRAEPQDDLITALISARDAQDRLTETEREARGSFAGCIAGALSFAEFEAGLAAVGLVDVEITPTHMVAEGMASAIIKATKPGPAGAPAPTEAAAAAKPRITLDMLPLATADAACCSGDGCC